MSLPIPKTTPVLIVGGGPAGLITALPLSRQSVPCILIERNLSTTRWPKMDISNARTMELFRPNRLDVGQGLRDIGVSGEFSMDVSFSTGLSEGGEEVARWKLPSHDEYRGWINGRGRNDGGLPREAPQRCSQALFEAWLKPRIEGEEFIKSFWGVKFEDFLEETDEGVVCVLSDVKTGEKYQVKAQYVVGCDGGGSRVRRRIGGEMIGGEMIGGEMIGGEMIGGEMIGGEMIGGEMIGGEMIGGPVPSAMYLVHFRSRDLTRIHAQGQFWHIFFTTGHVLISQDEKDIWTLHTPIPLDQDPSKLDPYEAVYSGLGGKGAPYPIAIDEILVSSTWRPNIFCADRFQSHALKSPRIFLSGDAAHQLAPTGGYGMNTAVGDSFDIGWKLAAVVKGYGGDWLLKSYQEERMPVAKTNVERCGVHWGVHMQVWTWVGESNGLVRKNSEEGRALREGIRKHVAEFDGENKELGIELGYRYRGSSVIVWDDEDDVEPEWSYRNYVPSTWPGARAPQVFLKDGKTNVFDLFGRGGYSTIVDFSTDGAYGKAFEGAAKEMDVPIKVVHLPKETHVRNIWQRDAVLVRPDDHVCWRARVKDDPETFNPKGVLMVALGKERNKRRFAAEEDIGLGSIKETSFTGTAGIVDRDTMEKLGEIQGKPQ